MLFLINRVILIESLKPTILTTGFRFSFYLFRGVIQLIYFMNAFSFRFLCRSRTLAIYSTLLLLLSLVLLSIFICRKHYLFIRRVNLALVGMHLLIRGFLSFSFLARSSNLFGNVFANRIFEMLFLLFRVDLIINTSLKLEIRRSLNTSISTFFNISLFTFFIRIFHVHINISFLLLLLFCYLKLGSLGK